MFQNSEEEKHDQSPLELNDDLLITLMFEVIIKQSSEKFTSGLHQKATTFDVIYRQGCFFRTYGH